MRGSREPRGTLADLVWLIGRSARNRGISLISKLRSPRYLVAFLVGVGYFAVLFLPPLLSGEPMSHTTPEWLHAVAPLALVGWVLFAWLRLGRNDALAFDPAEVHFLFTGPISRPTLIRYKILRAQIGVLLSVLFVSFFAGRGAVGWPLTLASYWILLTTLHLHQMAASLTRLTAARGRAGLKRAAVPLMVAGAAAVAIGWTVASAVARMRRSADWDAAIEAALATLREPVPTVALFPFRVLIEPLRAATPAAWLATIPLAVFLLALHYAWVMRTDAAFEEAAAEAGQKRERIRSAIKSGTSWWKAMRGQDDREARRWWRPRLSPDGEPALALGWKNLLAATQDVRPTTLLVVLLGMLAVGVLMAWAAGSFTAGMQGMAVVAAMFAGMVLFFGPLGARYDLRRDLRSIELLATYPVAPLWLVASEVGTTALLLTVAQSTLLLLAMALLPLAGVSGVLLVRLELLGVALLVLLPALTLLQVIIQNALALLFPSWVRIGASTVGGVEHLGQNILTLLGAMVSFFLLLLPPAILALLVHLSFAAPLGRWAAVPAMAALVAGFWAEAVLLVRWLAGVYERLDPVEAGLLH